MTRLDEIREIMELGNIGSTDADWLLERVEMLARLVETEPACLSEGLVNCGYCEMVRERWGSTGRHAPDCPWRQAREMMDA